VVLFFVTLLACCALFFVHLSSNVVSPELPSNAQRPKNNSRPKQHSCIQQVTLPRHEDEVPLTNIQWLHFPKAGTSFVSTLWNYACGERGLKGFPLDLTISPVATPTCSACYDIALKARYPVSKYCQPDAFGKKFQTQHAPVSLVNLSLFKWQVVAMFRRPSQRLISAYYGGRHTAGFSKMEYQTMLKKLPRDNKGGPAAYARYPGIAGCTARMLTGARCAESAAARPGAAFDSGRARLSEALEMVKKLAFVGLMERWDESICLFHRMFGGPVNTIQLLDFHAGSRHRAEYNESLLEGFRDEVDEQIYQAAVVRYEELAQKYLGDRSVCSQLLTPSARMRARNATCSCLKEARECGVSTSQGIDCGECPEPRLKFFETDPARFNVTAAPRGKLSCYDLAGVCMVGRRPFPQLFAWNFTNK